HDGCAAARQVLKNANRRSAEIVLHSIGEAERAYDGPIQRVRDRDQKAKIAQGLFLQKGVRYAPRDDELSLALHDIVYERQDLRCVGIKRECGAARRSQPEGAFPKEEYKHRKLTKEPGQDPRVAAKFVEEARRLDNELRERRLTYGSRRDATLAYRVGWADPSPFRNKRVFNDAKEFLWANGLGLEARGASLQRLILCFRYTRKNHDRRNLWCGDYM